MYSMSLGYADRLSYRADLGGRLGAPELSDHAVRVVQGIDELAELVSVWPVRRMFDCRAKICVARNPGRV